MAHRAAEIAVHPTAVLQCRKRAASASRGLQAKITSTFIRAARLSIAPPCALYFTNLKPQPKPTFSALADLWAVRWGPAVSVALADLAGLWVSAAERASSDRYVVGCNFFDLTF